ncbi:MAG: hypothetical protein AUK44_10345 [Porphyromonadaceae bacterium CG2_30_38_12]|nr:MAG: hypothetical protein AUK44_10345 [Porphyromonadaceae bacterium CG2_30_38_12]
MKIIKIKFCVLFFTLLSFLSISLNAQDNNLMLNVSGAADYETDRAFCNVMRTARSWDSISTNPVIHSTLDSKGWPVADAEIIVWHGIDRMHGTYKLQFTGTATIEGSWTATTITNKIYDSATNTTTADVIITETGKGGLKLKFRNTIGGVKNVKMMRPIAPGSSISYAFDDYFQPVFIDMLKKFKVIRFLGWSGVNGSKVADWDKRTPEDIHWGSRRYMPIYGSNGKNLDGIAMETCIRACNAADRDLWIQIPVKATDDFVTQQATLIKNLLKPTLKVYVEYANELWNTAGSFPQSGINHTAAMEEVAAGSSLNFDGTTNDWVWAFRRIAKRGAACSLIFRSVFGDAAMMTRVRPMLEWQKRDGQGTATQCMKWLDYYSQQNNKPINYYFYGGGGSSYYSPLTKDSIPLDSLWTNDEFDVNIWKKSVVKDANLAAAMGLKYASYEGGPGLDDYGINVDVKKAAVLDPRMKNCILEHHKIWDQVGGDLFGYFISNGNFQWGFSPDVLDWDKSGNPKLDALNQILASNRDSITLGHAVPFSVDGAAFDKSRSGNPATGALKIERGEGRYWGYTFHGDEGAYKLTLEHSKATNGSVKIIVDGAVITNLTLNSAANDTVTSPEGLFLLSKGLHMVRIWQNSDLVANEFSLVRLNVAKMPVSANPVILTPASNSTFRPGDYVTATGNGDNLAWQITNGADVIKTGLGATISFTVPINAANNNQITIQLNGGAGGNTMISNVYTVVDDTPAIQLIDQIPTALVPYSYQLAASGTGVPFSWTSNNLPAGLSMTSLGKITGTVNAAGTYNFDVTATDVDGDTSTQTITFEVQGIPDMITQEAEVFNATNGCRAAGTVLDFGKLNSWVQWDVYVNETTTYDITFTYANNDSIRPVYLTVNGDSITLNDFPSTGGWDIYGTTTFSGVALNALKNTLRLTATTAPGGANIDKFEVKKHLTTEVKKSNNDILIYPNPAQNTLFISALVDQIVIYDMLGVKQINTKISSNNINISDLKPTIYFLQLFKNGNLVHEQKFLKK